MESHTPATAALRIMHKLGLLPDPWQTDVLCGTHRRLLLNCCRQAGKSTIVALHALLHAIYTDELLVLLLSCSHRQSIELFHIVTRFYARIGAPGKKRLTTEELLLSNGSRIVSLPSREETIRGYSNVGMLIIDEASRVPDDIYKAVRPMLAVSNGQLICMSTPRGKRGFFYEAWVNASQDWQRIEVPADRVPRIKPEFLAEERLSLGDTTFRQEYYCSFESVEGLVYPGMAKCVVAALPKELSVTGPELPGQRVGGIDFGFRNPFAAVWGILDKKGILWLTNEHYCRNQPLSVNAGLLPRNVMWYVDPAGANERAELIRADFKVRKGINAKQSGISAVASRILKEKLKIIEGQCPNLLAEAGLYCYSTDPQCQGVEEPVNEYNHALDALRYLVSRLDERNTGRPDGPASGDGNPPPDSPPPPRKPDPWLRYDNEELWTILK
jgi:hypothetical protein